MILLLIAAAVLQNVTLSGNIFAFALAVFLTLTSLFSFGILLSCLCSNVKQATGIGFTILIPMIFLSGATMPLSAFPDAMSGVANLVPLRYAVVMLQNTFLGKPFSDSIVPMLVLASITVVCTVLSFVLFKWE